jgi:hypothetical protein
MSGLEVEVVPAEMVGGDAPQAVMKPTVEVVFDTVRSAEGATVDPEAQGRIARGIAALQRAGGGVGKVPAEAGKAAAKAAEAPADDKKGSSGIIVDVIDPEKGSDGAKEAPAEAKEGDKAASEGEKKAAEADSKAGSPDLDQIRSDLAIAQARIDALSTGSLPDEERTTWLEKPVDWIRAEAARRLGVKPDSEEAEKVLAHLQWELTLDRMGVAKEALPKDIKERNDTEHATRQKALAETARKATEAAKTQGEGRAAVHKLVMDQLAASADKFPHAADGALINLGGVPAAEAAIYLWGEAVKRGEVKNTGDDAKDIPEALRLYDKFCKTQLGKTKLQNATPPPANTPAASKEAASGKASKSPPTLSQKDAAAAPAAKKVDTVPLGPETIDASDNDARRRRVRAIASKHFAGKQ